jgi:hypothetical protein
MPDRNGDSLPEIRPDPAFDRKFRLLGWTLLALAIAASTYLHYFRPHLLRVPDPTDVTEWKNPSFEETCVYDRMTDEERAKVRAEGVPRNTVPALLFSEVFSIFIAALCFAHVRKYSGSWMANCFLLGSFVFTGMQESIWILFGRFTGSSASLGIGEEVFGTYFFSRGGLWFIETPVFVCLGWFVWAYAAVWVAGKVFPGMNLVGRAFVGASLPMLMDVWIDPVFTSPEHMNWVWAKGDCLLLFGIPHVNFLGWFFLIFLFAIFWEQLPKWERHWGRLKATIVFFVTLVAAELAILAFFFPWCLALKQILLLAGAEQGLKLPAGW